MQKTWRQTLWCGPGWRPSGQQPPSMLPATLPYIAPPRPSVSAPVGQSWERAWSCGGWRALDPARQHDKTSQASEPWSPPLRLACWWWQEATGRSRGLGGRWSAGGASRAIAATTIIIAGQITAGRQRDERDMRTRALSTSCRRRQRLSDDHRLTIPTPTPARANGKRSS